jgi:hypothetical protein
VKEWYKPIGSTIELKTTEIRPGSVLNYSILTSKGVTLFCKIVYTDISWPNRLGFVQSFTNEKGETIRDTYNANWPKEMSANIKFEDFKDPKAKKDEKDVKDKTQVTVSWEPFHPTEIESAEYLAGADGMKLYWGGVMLQLEDYLKRLD